MKHRYEALVKGVTLSGDAWGDIEIAIGALGVENLTYIMERKGL